jgi:hypothetical protein
MSQNPEKLTVNLVTWDPDNEEYVLYLVEEGPWEASSLPDRLRQIQKRIYNAVDAVIDGHFATRFPDSKGKKARIKLDYHTDAPLDAIEVLLNTFGIYISQNEEHQRAIEEKAFISGLRIASRFSMGRGGSGVGNE